MTLPDRMTREEVRATAGLAGIYSLRLLGVFLLLPVFAVYAEHLPGGENHTLVGIALGIYGLTQALLQIPFGWLSDRRGRKQVIYLGLTLFAAGSGLCAAATDIHAMLLGRVLQGAGAISSTVIALLADLTREEHRTKAMAAIGSTIGVTFGVSLVVGPLLNRLIGVPGIFALTGVLAVAALWVVKRYIPDPLDSHFHSDAEARPGDFRTVLTHPELLRLDYGIFALHAALTAMFVVVPFALTRQGLPLDHHWQVYLPVMVVAFLAMIPAIIWAEKKAKLKIVFTSAVALLTLALAGLAWGVENFTGLVAGLFAFFLAFNVLEASLPSLVSKIAPARSKGTASGVYSSVQFLGMFVGGALGGYLSQHHGPQAVLVLCAVLALGWLVVAATMAPPPAVRSRMYHIDDLSEAGAADLSRRLAGLRGVREAVVLADEKVAYLKVNLDNWDEAGVLELIGGSA